MLERKEETKIVKGALAKLGYQDIKVTHGRGTAWGWLTVEVSVNKPAGCDCDMSNPHRLPYYCSICSDTLHTNRVEITDILLETTGRRRGDYDGNTLVEVKLLETTEAAPDPVPDRMTAITQGLAQQIANRYPEMGVTCAGVSVEPAITPRQAAYQLELLKGF